MIWRTIKRLIIVFFASILAALTSMTMLMITSGRELVENVSTSFEGDQGFSIIFETWSMILFASSLGATLTLTPALTFIIIGEVAKIRSAIYYMIAGGLSLLAIPLLYVTGDGITAVVPNSRYMIIFLASGFTGGFVYWLLAGRSS